MSTDQIVIHRNGRVSVGGVDLYKPGSATFEAFHMDETTPNVLLFSRRGTGKSWGVRWELHRRALKYPGYKYLVVRNSKPELKRTHLAYLPKEMDQLGGTYASVDGTATYENGSIGMFLGFEREADALKLIGADLDCLVPEEVTTMSWALVVDLATSLRTTVKSGRIPQLIAPTNPYGKYAEPVKRHWITQDITQEEEPGYNPRNWKAIRLTADDNPALAFDAYDQRLGALSLAKRKAWLLGEWSCAEGSYFDDFEPDRDGKPWHTVTRLPDISSATIYRTIDWGFVDACAVLWIALFPSGRLLAFRERTYFRTVAAEVAREVIGSSRDLRIAQTYADPSMFNGSRAGAVSIGDVMEQSGVPLTPSVNNRADAGTAIHTALCTILDDGLPQLQIWREGCPQLIKSLPQMQANPLHPDRIADSSVDHHPLALAYFLLGAGPLVRGVPLMGPPSSKRWMLPKAGNIEVLGNESVKR